jgi:uncharacterized protein (TIGR02996 family)
MSSHPDADAFMRAYLQQPTDVTARLVFADWLEETGKPWNVAWAHYIRAKAEADHYEFGSPERAELEERAAGHARRVQAKLTIPASLFVGYPKSLLELLPPDRITVRIGHFLPPAATVARVEEALARHFPLLPLDDSAGALIVAHATPDDARAVALIRSVLSARTVMVGAAWDDIVAGINAAYAAVRDQAGLMARVWEGIPTAFDHPADLEYMGDPASFLDRVLTACHQRRGTVLTFIPNGDRVRVLCRTGDDIPELAQVSEWEWYNLLFPEIRRRGEASGMEFTVEVVRNGTDQAVRIWL